MLNAALARHLWMTLCLLALAGCQGSPDASTRSPQQPPEPSPPGSAPAASPGAARTPGLGGEPGVVASLDLVEAKRQGRLSALEIVQAQILEDPAYHKPMRYRGWRLVDVLGLMPELDGLDDSAHELRMIAQDGYVASASLAQLRDPKGVIAFEDASRPQDQPWETFAQGKRQITPAPLYLVWDQTPYGPGRPWPYQLAKLQVVSTRAAYGQAYPAHVASSQPPDGEQIMAGFALYKQRCMSCHSVNLSGGQLGPELNVPRSVTEYWSAEHLRGFIRRPGDYRARSVMPAHLDLDEAALDALLAYLTAMRQAKRCQTQADCERLIASAGAAP